MSPWFPLTLATIPTESIVAVESEATVTVADAVELPPPSLSCSPLRMVKSEQEKAARDCIAAGMAKGSSARRAGAAKNTPAIAAARRDFVVLAFIDSFSRELDLGRGSQLIGRFPFSGLGSQ
jgi:hypothetical protein